MAQTLAEFIEEAKKELAKFEKMWREQHAKNPENFPLKMEDGNEGLWWEQFTMVSDNDEDENEKES